jgi:type II secretory pathway component PulK
MNAKNIKSQATILVLSILGVVSLIGFSFLYMNQVQLRGSNTYMARLQSRYLAEAGINHAREALKFDKMTFAIDSYEDIWYISFSGSDVDLDGDGIKESRWFYVKDAQGADMGRYAVLVQDESAKVNINSAAKYYESGFIQGQSTYEVSIKKLFDNLNLNGEDLTQQVLDYRYGQDRKPGSANSDDDNNNYYLERDLIDNDADGVIDEDGEGVDEPGEFDVNNPRADDKPFVVKEELRSLPGISKSAFLDMAHFITTSSKEKETSSSNSMRQNVNYIKSDNLIKIMLDQGISDPWQKAANILDSIDENFSRTTVFKHYNLIEPVAGQTVGDWAWVSDHYECDTPEGIGTWTWNNLSVTDGEYYCFIYGSEGKPVGDVTIGGQVQESMYSADAFIKSEQGKVKVENSTFSVSIQNNEELGDTCYFKFIELIPEDIDDSSALSIKELHGVEPVRINEIMIKPVVEINTTSSFSPGGSWVWQTDLFVNSDPGSGLEGQGTWVFENIPNGYYYLRLFGKDGEFIGDVEVGGQMQESVRNGDYFIQSNSVCVDSNKLIIKIQNNFSNKTCYFKGIALSQQPDAEYVELVNISNSQIDLSGWMLETTGQEGVVAFMPQGTIILPLSYLVLCVDKQDEAPGINGNNISFVSTWATQQAVQLDFFKTLDRSFDFLKDNPIAEENYLVLKNSEGSIVDKVEYLNSQVSNYLALERADPTEESDSNNNSEFDGWFVTSDLSGGTPSRENNNEDMKKDEFSTHAISEVSINNHRVSSIVDLAYVSKSNQWQKLGLSDISLFIDSLTVSGKELYPKDSNLSGWQEIGSDAGGFYSNNQGEEGVWGWQNLSNGDFFLTIKGEPQEALTVSYKKADDFWQILTHEDIPDDEGLVYCGIISIGEDNPEGTKNNTLEIKLTNTSSSGTAHFYYLRLDPLSNIYGRININTAPQEVLLALPYINTPAASAIINSRPLGNKDGLNRGIGDLLLLDLFEGEQDQIDKLSSFSNMVSVRSDVFQIISRAEVLEGDKVVATQEIKTIIER